MLRVTFLLVSLLALSTVAIKVPVDKPTESPIESNTRDKKLSVEENPTFAQQDEISTDSYLVKPEEDQPELPQNGDTRTSDGLPSPAIYLLPPLPNAPVDFLSSGVSQTETDTADWTPMTQALPKPKYGPVFNPKALSLIEVKSENEPEAADTSAENKNVPQPIITPSLHLQPPLQHDVPKLFYFPQPSHELQVPLFEPHQGYNRQLKTKIPVKFSQKPIPPTIALELTPPEPQQVIKYNNPTKLYPKKYALSAGFKPIPIPVNQYVDGKYLEVPEGKPVKIFKPLVDVEEDYIMPPDDKARYKFEQAQQKRLNRDEDEVKKQQEFVDSSVEQAFGKPASEQQASETGFYGSAPQDSFAAPAPADAHAQPSPAERTEFRMHGMHGPHSYQFGYDTGKGKNRQFRYEERDNDGFVRGHYGYMDKRGKLQVVNYDAHPQHGFHAEGPFGKV